MSCNCFINLYLIGSGSELLLSFDFFLLGVAFYSISDIADRLLSTPAHPVPSLQEDYWLSRSVSDPSGLLSMLLEELSPAAMAAFDLACCHCHLWKTSRQLLDTAERRLSSSLEARGPWPEFRLLVSGFSNKGNYISSIAMCWSLIWIFFFFWIHICLCRSKTQPFSFQFGGNLWISCGFTTDHQDPQSFIHL